MQNLEITHAKYEQMVEWFGLSLGRLQIFLVLRKLWAQKSVQFHHASDL